MLLVELAGAAAILTLLLSLLLPGPTGTWRWRLLTALGLAPLLPLVLRFYELPAAVGADPWPALRVVWIIAPLLLLALLVLGWSISPGARLVFAIVAPVGGLLLLALLRQVVLRFEAESGASPDDAVLWSLCSGAAVVSTLGLWLGRSSPPGPRQIAA